MDFESVAGSLWPPALDEQQMAEFLQKARSIAPKYHTELLESA
ncbi:MAG: hypothetical protein ACLGXA_09460 [Acidobacteriota bacterium]